MMRQWVICDLDGTLSDCSHRVQLIPDWDAFHERSVDDKPYDRVVQLLTILNDYHPVLILTGRTITYAGITHEWLRKYRVPCDELWMRPELDHTPDAECKWSMAVKFFGSEEAVLANTFLVIEDRDKVVEMWRNKGLTCLQPRLGDY